MKRFFLTPVVAIMLATASAHAGIGVGFDPTTGDTIETGSDITINNQSGGNCSGQWYLNGEPVGDPFPVSPGTNHRSAPPVPGDSR